MLKILVTHEYVLSRQDPFSYWSQLLSAPKTIVVIPTYNEAGNIPRLAKEIFALNLDNLELLVVDDNSPDGTGQIAEDLSEQYDQRIHVLHRSQKEGLGPAYIAGLKYALRDLNAEQCIQMDADFSHQPKYIPDLLRAADTEGFDFIIGSRYVEGGGVDESWGWFRKLVSWFANRVYVPTILHIPVRDATGGFRFWKKDALIGIDLDRIRSNGYVFLVEIAYVTYKLGYKMGEVPIYFPDRQIGDSKMDSSVAIEAALRTWQILFRHRQLSPNDRRTEPY